MATPAKANQLIISNIPTLDVVTEFLEGARTVTDGAGTITDGARTITDGARKLHYVTEISTTRFVDEILECFYICINRYFLTAIF